MQVSAIQRELNPNLIALDFRYTSVMVRRLIRAQSPQHRQTFVEHFNQIANNQMHRMTFSRVAIRTRP